MDPKPFFDYVKERQHILLRRRAGKPRPWSNDPVLDTFKFCNVFREDDRTTVWFREHVRNVYRDTPDVMLATTVFRMFNRIEVGEAIFCQPSMLNKNRTAFELLLPAARQPLARRRDAVDAAMKHTRAAIKNYCGRGPYATGAYIISSPPGYGKLDGIIEILSRFACNEVGGVDWTRCAHRLAKETVTLQWTHEWLSRHDYFGRFHAYEIVTDLRHTLLLQAAPDLMKWANPGPGCRRGLNRLYGRDLDERVPVEQLLVEMRELLALSRKNANWPSKWPRWEMREVEHQLCEFDKYQRCLAGGRTRSVYR